jgi:hypothetical protein
MTTMSLGPTAPTPSRQDARPDRYGRNWRLLFTAGTVSVLGDGAFVAVLLGAGSMSASLWNVAVVSLRQRLVPPHLLGRVSSAGIMVVWGMQPLGALAGGLVAAWFGLAVPWIVGGALRVVVSALAIRPLREWQD